jgi:hypothetical protein
VTSTMISAAGADASFFSFLNKDTRVPLFTKNFQVFHVRS